MSLKVTSEISILVPLYNEEEVFNSLILRLKNVISETSFVCSVYLINDGSYDKTYNLINKIYLVSEDIQSKKEILQKINFSEKSKNTPLSPTEDVPQ